MTFDDRRKDLDQRTQDVLTAFGDVPKDALGLILRLQACVIALVELEDRCAKMNDDPYPPLLKMLSNIRELPAFFHQIYPHLNSDAAAFPVPLDDHSGTQELFQTAWTTYNPQTYRHSLGLMQSRLACSGYDKTYFAGKRCIDSGCGTGRFAIAMALEGAKEVVAADFGDELLTFLKERKNEYQVPQVQPVKMDVTDMSAFETGSFDFVASHGVLHHTPHPDRGIREHFRITRPGGQYWLYLYGAGGVYWPIYDELRKLLLGIEPKIIRQVLRSFGLREGLIYTFLDNFLAPRVYYSLEQTLDLLRPLGTFSYVHMKGTSPVDDTEKVLATRWGRELWGPDGGSAHSRHQENRRLMQGALDNRDVALVSQMRAGTHYMCMTLRIGLEAEMLRPADGGIYVPMSDEKILSELRADSRFELPAPRPGNRIYFSHYYHPHHRNLQPMPRISLIGFPFDSFYSDGVVYSDPQYSAGPSASRPHAKDYVFRHQSPEWTFLEERMHQNAGWLNALDADLNNLIVRYEDLSDRFEELLARIQAHVGPFYRDVPGPVVNRKRTFWTGDYASRFDPAALSALKSIFGPAISRFYPERAIELGLV